MCALLNSISDTTKGMQLQSQCRPSKRRRLHCWEKPINCCPLVYCWLLTKHHALILLSYLFFLISLSFFSVLKEDEFIIFWNIFDLRDKLDINVYNIYSWYEIMLVQFCKPQNPDLHFVSEIPNSSLIFQKGKSYRWNQKAVNTNMAVPHSPPLLPPK